MFRKIAFLLSALASASFAAPAPFMAPELPPDAPFSLPDSTYESAIECPNGITNKAGGVVLLVHGTTSTGSESWRSGPYAQLLPKQGPGFDVCWVTLPNRGVTDIQIAGEYVAYSIKSLSARSPSTNFKISVIGHSQGNINIQWALTFWPSTRPLITNFVSLAGLFHGSGEGPIYCSLSKLLGIGCPASFFQQSAGSKYLAAQNSKVDANSGAQALVPTTSIYTTMDEIIQPEVVPNPTSGLTGATVIPLQSDAVCGLLHVADHFLMLIDPAAFHLAVDALVSGHPTDVRTFNKIYCSGFVDNAALDFSNIPGFVKAAFNSLVTAIGSNSVHEEPQLAPYVCARGYAKQCRNKARLA